MSPQSEKTEQPTGKRVAESREKGMVANSRELTQAAVLMVGILLLGNSGKELFRTLSNITIDAVSLPRDTITLASLRGILFQYATQVLPSTTILILGLLGTGVTSTLLQTRGNWASENVGFKLSRVRLNPLAWFQQVFSTTGYFELGKAILKLGLIGYVTYSFINSHLNDFLSLAGIGIKEAFYYWSTLAYDLCLQAAWAYLILAIADFLYQRWSKNRDMKMTKQEVKDESMQQEGNPLIKSTVRGRQRRAAMMRMMSKVPKADVVITNPTHLAIAIQYSPEMKTPKVLAKGARLVAERIVKVATENHVPIVQNIPLARSLFSTVEVDQDIPPELYMAVAEVLVYIFRLRGKLQQTKVPVAANNLLKPPPSTSAKPSEGPGISTGINS